MMIMKLMRAGFSPTVYGHVDIGTDSDP